MSRRRSDRKQITVLVDAGLAAAVRDIAIHRGMTLTALIEGALEVCVDGYAAIGPDGGGRFGEASGRDGSDGGGGSGTGVVAASNGGVNWDQILAEGISKRAAAPWSVAEAVADSAVNPYRLDPIEEIA